LQRIPVPPFNTQRPSETQLAEWERTLWDRGYLLIENALPPAAVEHFHSRMKQLPAHWRHESHSIVCLFEQGMDFVHLLENEPVVSLMRRILGERMHIIALQGHRMFRGNEVSQFHSDELYAPQPGEADERDAGAATPPGGFPPIINTVNCHYYLTDVPIELGPTEVVPHSHRAWRQPRKGDGEPPTFLGHAPVAMTCKAGDCVIYSNQVWHRGRPNLTDRTRMSVVPSYARRFVAQRFWPFLNYNLSREILDRCSPSQRELLGEHPRAAYG